MSGPVRVLVVEDPRRSLAAWSLAVELDGQPELAIVGVAPPEAQLLGYLRAMAPEVVVVDAGPGCPAAVALAERITSERPTPVVVLWPPGHGAPPAEGSASGLVVRASLPPPGAPDRDARRRELVSTLVALAGVKLVRRRASTPPPAPAASQGARAVRRRILALAGSTGGPGALRSVLRGLGSAPPVPVVLVQHLAGDPALFATWLAGESGLPVEVASDGDALRRGSVHLAPQGSHLRVLSDRTLSLSDADPRHGFRPSACVLFESVAEAFGRSAVAVVLSGMGKDGSDGLRLVHARGGHVVAQDAGTSVVFGMPRAAIEAGGVSAVLPLDRIGPHLAELFA